MSGSARQRLELQRQIAHGRPVRERYLAELARADEDVTVLEPELRAAEAELNDAQNAYVQLRNTTYTPTDYSTMGHPAHLAGDQHPEAMSAWNRLQAAKTRVEPLDREMGRLRIVRARAAERVDAATDQLAQWQAELAELEAVAFA